MHADSTTDVRGLNLDKIVDFRARSVEVYPSGYPNAPSVGSGLNKPALVTLYGISHGSKSPEEYKKKLILALEKQHV